MTNKIKISGYCTVRNGVSMDYPFEATIRSLLDFCDEVIVADSSDENDGTQDVLQSLVNEDNRVSVYHVDVPWDAPNYGIYDGQMKAFAREQCTGDFLWQIDSDEVVQPGTRQKIEELLPKVNFLKETPLIALPVVEFWGGPDKVRIDVNPWKWRLSRNDKTITHGIPSRLRRYENGLLYAKQGTDGCDYIHSETGEIIPCIHFIKQDIEHLRQAAITQSEVVPMYQFWFQTVTEQLPTVYHFSWWSIAAKIQKYKKFWNNSWLTLYGEKNTKPKGWNPFFDKPLCEVSDKEIKAKAIELALNTGGHIFHTKWTGQKINHIQIEQTIPSFIEKWAKEHRDIP